MQHQVITLSEHDRRNDARRDPSANLAAIIAHAQQLAADARAAQTPVPTSAQLVRGVIAARAARSRFFSSELFADPAWDILLELYALTLEQRRTSVSKLCIAAAVPATTALRWIDKLYADGLIERAQDPTDARRVWVAFSDRGRVAMASYFNEVASGARPL